MSIYWTRIDLQDEWKTLKEAEDDLNDIFRDSLADSSADYGVLYEDEEEIVLYDFDNDKILKRATVFLGCEFSRSDREEHGTYWGRP